MVSAKQFLTVLVAVAVVAGGAPAAVGAGVDHDLVVCTQIKTAAQLQAMKNNLAGSYCLANDIDAKSVANFKPIGDDFKSFTGRLYGNDHVIYNLTINSSKAFVGLFGVTDGALIRDLGLVNAKITGTKISAVVGGVGGALVALGSTTGDTSTITRVYVTGQIKCTGSSCIVGGIAGGIQGTGSFATLTNSWSSAIIIGSAGSIAGGATGVVIPPAVVIRTFATGSVTCGASCTAGGLIGESLDTADAVYASGPVTGGDSAKVGGLIGLQQNGVLRESYAVGPVSGGAGASLGGLIGSMAGTPSLTNSYWDTTTSGQAASAGGTGKSTTQLRAALPAGFGSAWAITKTLSFPFLNDGDVSFASTLATLVVSNKIFTFLPISQLTKSEYLHSAPHASAASLAAVYTMIARAIGITNSVPQLKGVKIDKYFWHDATQKTTWAGPVTGNATLSKLVAIPSGTTLGPANVIGKMSAHKLVILRGTYTKSGGGTATHYMLGTLFTKNPNNSLNTVVANDPLTGEQVEINPNTKKVISPTDFPLADFKVDGYQPVTIH